MSFKKNDRFVRGNNHQNIRVAHHRRRVDWIGEEGKIFEQICNPPSEYLDQPKNLHPRTHLQYDIDRGFIEQVTSEEVKKKVVWAEHEIDYLNFLLVNHIPEKILESYQDCLTQQKREKIGEEELV